MKSEIAYIDDSQLNLDCIKTIFDQDFEVQIFSKPELFLTKFPKSSYSCILIDIHMPTMDGFTLYEKVIEHPIYNGCPILFISSDDSDAARIKSFTLGAVDFLARQTGPDEMIARVKSKIQFFQKHRSIIEFGPLKINLTLLKTYLNNKELPLTFIELKILCHLLKNYPDSVSKENLVEHVWRTSHVLDATIYTHISNLNGKLKDWDHEVQTVKNKGVQLVKKEN
ncbi:MAG: response regulator transcription factor [Bacteriovoracaceae bacterium]